jgi:predicted small secreted protein
MKRLIIISMLAILPCTIAACNTIGGMGHDVKNAGGAVQSAASEAK